MNKNHKSNYMSLTDEIKQKLLPYQIDHTENIIYSLKTYNRALDSSDTGCGKTYTSIAAAISLNLKPFIVCPKSVLSSWKNVLDIFNCPYYGLSNYESLQNCRMYTKMSKDDKIKCPYIKRVEVTNIETTEKKKKKKKKMIDGEVKDKIEYTYVWDNLPADILFIFDEAHRCKNPRTLNSIMLYTLAKTTSKIAMLSATLSDKPENFSLAGFVLGLYKNIRYAGNWMQSIGKEYDNICTAIHDSIFPEYASRMRIRDLGNLFPDNQVLCECYDTDNNEEIERNYRIIEEEVLKLKNKSENSGNALARILFARMEIETLKIPIYIELANKFLEEGNSVAIFVNFTNTLKTLADELKTNCVIHGQQTMMDRDKNIADFNSDKSRIIICNVASGGVGISLHDLNGIYPRVSIISPGYSAQTILQALGRIYRANTKTAVRQRIVFSSCDIEKQICQNMKDKITNIASLNDGDLLSYQIEGLTDELAGIDKHEGFTQFEILFQKINVLTIKYDRLVEELKQTKQELDTLKLILDNEID